MVALYPLYKIIKPFVQISRQLLRDRIYIARIPDLAMRAILLVSHEVSIFVLKLLEKLATRFNVISVLLGPGSF